MHRRQAGGECEHIAAASDGQESDGTAQRKQAERIAPFSKEPEPLPGNQFLVVLSSGDSGIDDINHNGGSNDCVGLTPLFFYTSLEELSPFMGVRETRCTPH